MRQLAAMVILSGSLAQTALAEQVSFPHIPCDFRGMACASDVDELQVKASQLLRDATGARAEARHLRAEVARLSDENTRLRAEMTDMGSEEQWARERQKVVGDYTLMMICLRDATTLEAAKACLDG